ncbi:MAG: hypothetical protein ACOC16_03885 [Nanoarchaeota archaeon]
MFNKNQIRIIEYIYRDNLSIKQLEKKLNLSYITIIRNLKKLKDLDLINKNNLKSNSLLAFKLKELIDKQINLNFLKKTNFNVLQVLLNKELNIKEIQEETNLKKTQIYKAIKELKNQSIVFEENNKLKLNKVLWEELINFIVIYKSTFTYLNFKLPKNSKVLFKYKDKIIFENEDSNLNYQKTAFSNYNFDLYYNKNIYTTQKEKLTKQQIYIDSLNVAKSQREYLLCALYYLKNNINNIKHKVHDKIVSIIKENKKFKNFPTKKEIMSKEQ